MKMLFVACLYVCMLCFIFKSLKCQYKEENNSLLIVERSKAFVLILDSGATEIPVTGSKCANFLTG